MTSWGHPVQDVLLHWSSQPTDSWAKALLCSKVICFSVIDNQKPQIQDFTFEISAHILYPITNFPLFLNDSNLLIWPVYPLPSPDCEFYLHIPESGEQLLNETLCCLLSFLLPWQPGLTMSLQTISEAFRIAEFCSFGWGHWSQLCPSHTGPFKSLHSCPLPGPSNAYHWGNVTTFQCCKFFKKNSPGKHSWSPSLSWVPSPPFILL